MEIARAFFGYLAAISLFFLPGAALVSEEEWSHRDPVEALALSSLASLAFWAVSVWFSDLLPFGFSDFALLVLGSGAAVLALRAFRRPGRCVAWLRGVEPGTLSPLLGVVVLVVLECSILSTRITNSVGDLTMHAYMAELIVLRDGLPATHEPLLPIATFGQNSPGIHAVAALVTLWTGVPTYRTILLVGALALVLVVLALYVLLRRLLDTLSPMAAFTGGAAVLLVPRIPQMTQQWGGVPTPLSLAFMLILLAWVPALLRPCRLGFLLRAALLAAAVPLTHLLPTTFALYIIPLYAAFLLARERRQGQALRPIVLRVVFVVFIAGLLVGRFLLRTPLHTNPAILTWARGWIRTELERPLEGENLFRRALGLVPSPNASLLTLAFEVLLDQTVVGTAAILAWLLLRVRRPHPSAALGVITIVVCPLLLAAGLYEFLPLWPSFYPRRVLLYWMIPLAFSCAEFAAWIQARLGRRQALALLFGWLLLFGVEGAAGGRLFGRFGEVLGLSGAAFWRSLLDRSNAGLTEEDLRAFAWIRQRTPVDAVFANNYTDGGLLIPAAAHRMITQPHYQSWWYDSEIHAWQARRGFDFVYIGATTRDPQGPWTIEGMTAEPDRYRMVFQSGRARVYQALHPPVFQ